MNHFDTGNMVMTAAVFEKMAANEDFYYFIINSMNRYKKRDWGDTCKEDAESNDNALNNDASILAVYIYRKGTPDETTIWIITEWDRSVTTILFPSEY